MREMFRTFQKRPDSHPFISGDGFRAIAKHILEPGTEAPLANGLRAGDIVWCQSEFLEKLKNETLSKTRKPIVLLLGNSDLNHDRSLRDITEKSQTRIFAQNLTESVPGVAPLPIGLENLYLQGTGDPAAFWKLRKAGIRKTQFRVFSSFAVSNNPEIRKRALEELKCSAVADVRNRMSPKEFRHSLAHYAFTACPPGRGVDTHRVWESLYLRAIPVTTRSYHSEFLQELGIPIWIVESFDELTVLNEKDLRERYEAFEPLLNTKAIWRSYWREKIVETARRIKAGATSTE